MAHQEILYDVADRIATLTLNRPEKLNAWTATMEEEVRAAMYEAEKDDAVRVVILTGAGRGFCAGADMQLLSALSSGGLSAAAAKRTGQVRGNGSSRHKIRPDFEKRYSYFPSILK